MVSKIFNQAFLAQLGRALAFYAQSAMIASGRGFEPRRRQKIL